MKRGNSARHRRHTKRRRRLSSGPQVLPRPRHGEMERMPVDPAERFDGTILIVAPHMDDEVLACGGLMARLPDKERIHVVYATDGMKSPSPVLPWRDSISPDLGRLRMRESGAALAGLAIPKKNLTFLALPEARLRKNLLELRRLLVRHIRDLRPDHVLVPFRFDRHPDHLAVNRVVTEARDSGGHRAVLTEYFVYYRWRLLPGRDIRAYVRPALLFEIDITEVAERKRAALECFATQTTRFYPWQTRPILTPWLLDEECKGPEIFLRADPELRGAKVFTGAVPWIRTIHRLEPALKKWSYLLKSGLTRGLWAIRERRGVSADLGDGGDGMRPEQSDDGKNRA